jgi:hypothetical protein
MKRIYSIKGPKLKWFMACFFYPHAGIVQAGRKGL